MNYKLKTTKPFWWSLTGAEWGTVAVTLGDSIYYPNELPTPILAHELVHIKQNGGSLLKHLWLMYKSGDLDFYTRLEQEAHQAQYEEALNYMDEQRAWEWVLESANKNPYGIKIEIKRK